MVDINEITEEQLIGLHYSRDEDIDYDEMERYADKVNRKYEYKEKDKSDDFELGM